MGCWSISLVYWIWGLSKWALWHINPIQVTLYCNKQWRNILGHFSRRQVKRTNYSVFSSCSRKLPSAWWWWYIIAVLSKIIINWMNFQVNTSKLFLYPQPHYFEFLYSHFKLLLMLHYSSCHLIISCVMDKFFC